MFCENLVGTKTGEGNIIRAIHEHEGKLYVYIQVIDVSKTNFGTIAKRELEGIGLEHEPGEYRR